MACQPLVSGIALLSENLCNCRSVRREMYLVWLTRKMVSFPIGPSNGTFGRSEGGEDPGEMNFLKGCVAFES